MSDMPDTFRPVTRTSLIEALRRRLQEDILSGRYPTGSALPPERELAARYGVTRTSLRHALVELRSLGLIAIRHGIGSIVEDIAARAGADALQHMAKREGGWDLSLLRDLLAARAHIGGLFGRVAAERRTQADLDILEAALHRAREFGADPSKLQLHENAFIRCVTVSTHLRTFVFLANSITAVYAGTLELFRSAFADSDWVLGCLAGIYSAIRDGDGPRAEREMDGYLRESGARMLAAVETHP